MTLLMLVDKSLSMWRQISENDKQKRIFEFATELVSQVLEYMVNEFPHQQVCVNTFSSFLSKSTKFSTNYDEMIKTLQATQSGDKSEILKVLQAVIRSYYNEWSSYQPATIIIISDGFFSTTYRTTHSFHDISTSTEAILFPFPCRLVWVILDKIELVRHRLDILRQFMVCPNSFENLHYPQVNLDSTSVNEIANKVCSYFTPYSGTLRFGFLNSPISLHPPPSACYFESKVKFPLSGNKGFTVNENLADTFPEELNIIGFLPAASTHCTPSLARHLTLDQRKIEKVNLSDTPSGPPAKKQCFSTNNRDFEQISCLEAEDSADKIPSFRVLLHASLTKSNKVAVVKLKHEWFALLFARHDEQKKKSTNLVLSVMPCGDIIPGVGPPSKLGIKDSRPPLTVFTEFSYSSNAHIWLKCDSMLAETTKLLKYLKKLSEKQSLFLSELNKIKNSAQIYSHYQVLAYVKEALRNERQNYTDQKTVDFLDCILEQLENIQQGKDITVKGIEFGRHQK